MLQQLDQLITLLLNGSQSLYVDGLACTITQTITWLPLAVLLLYIIIRSNDLTGVMTTVLAIGLCIFFADQMASTICKPLVGRYRPSQDPFIMYAVDVVNAYRGGRYGFFSSHAANTMAVATFVSLLIRHRRLTCWLYSWALLNCWSRVYLGVHYVGDLLVGCVWGVFVGWAIFRLWLRFAPGASIRRSQYALRRQFTAGGYSLASVELFIFGISFTYLSIAFIALWRQV